MQLSMLTIFGAFKKFRKYQVILKLHYALVIFLTRWANNSEFLASLL